MLPCVTAATLSSWRDAFPAAGEASLSAWPMDGEVPQSDRLKVTTSGRDAAGGLLEAQIALLERRTTLWPDGGCGNEPHRLTLQRQARTLDAKRPTATRHPDAAGDCLAGPDNRGTAFMHDVLIDCRPRLLPADLSRRHMLDQLARRHYARFRKQTPCYAKETLFRRNRPACLNPVLVWTWSPGLPASDQNLDQAWPTSAPASVCTSR